MTPDLFTALAAAVAAVVGAVVGALVMLRRLPIEEKTADANAAAKLTEAASDLVGDMRNELTRLQLKVEDLESRDRTLMGDVERLRTDLIAATERIRKLETENQQLRQINRDLVLQLAEEKEKRQALEAKLDELIDNGRGGRGGDTP